MDGLDKSWYVIWMIAKIYLLAWIECKVTYLEWDSCGIILKEIVSCIVQFFLFVVLNLFDLQLIT